MNRAMLAAAVLTLCAFECGLDAAGAPLEYSADTAHMFAAVDAVAADWRADSALPTIDTPRCTTALADVELRTATEREWVDALRMCPLTHDGCSTLYGCDGSACATGTVLWHDGRPIVYLSPGENVDGHAHTVRHEVAHVLSWCVGRGLDWQHAHADVWGADGVVWRTVEVSL